MPNRQEVMRDAEEYLRIKEMARAPSPILSSYRYGLFMIALSLVMLAASFLLTGIEGDILRLPGVFMFQIGLGLAGLGAKGGTRYRVTETTRYPQQTGEMLDMYLQICGGKFSGYRG